MRLPDPDRSTASFAVGETPNAELRALARPSNV